MEQGYLSDSAKKYRDKPSTASYNREAVMRLEHLQKSVAIVLKEMKHRKPELMDGLLPDDSLRPLEDGIDRLIRALDMCERNERWTSGKSSLLAEREQLDRHMMIAGTLNDRVKSSSVTDFHLASQKKFEQPPSNSGYILTDSHKNTPKKDTPKKAFQATKPKSPGHVVKEREKEYVNSIKKEKDKEKWLRGTEKSRDES